MKTYPLIIALALLAGCRSVPAGYEEVQPIIDVKGRTIAFVPFTTAPDAGAEVIDGVKIAELAAIQLAGVKDDARVVPPSRMRQALSGGVEEERYGEIAKAAGADYLVVGEIEYLNIVRDEMVQSLEGHVGLKCKVISMTTREWREYNITWAITFPPGRDRKYDPVLFNMSEAEFRNQLIRHAASWVSGLFHRHFREVSSASQIEMKWGFEDPAGKGER
jgi:hypothetical protein